MRIRLGTIIVGGCLMGGASIGVCAWRLPMDAAAAVQTQSQSQTQNTQQDSVAEAARKAREKAKTSAPAKKNYTNDTVPALRENQISVLKDNGNNVKDIAPDQTKPDAKAEPKKDEAYWRKRFADARAKLAIAERDLDVSQRELNLLQTQYYSDPNKELQQQYSRNDINAKTAKVDEKKEEVAKLTQAIEDLKDEMRHAGGLPGWAN